MNKSFLFAPLLVIAIGAMATMAHAGTVVIGGFAKSEKTMQILKKTEEIVFNGGAGNVFATCDGRMIKFHENELIGSVNAKIANSCKNGKLSVFISTIPQKVLDTEAEAQK